MSREWPTLLNNYSHEPSYAGIRRSLYLNGARDRSRPKRVRSKLMDELLFVLEAAGVALTLLAAFLVANTSEANAFGLPVAKAEAAISTFDGWVVAAATRLCTNEPTYADLLVAQNRARLRTEAVLPESQHVSVAALHVGQL